MKRFFAAILIATLIFSSPYNSWAQKPPIDHSVYDDWNSLNFLLAPDCGPWIDYAVISQRHDRVVHFRNVKTGKEYEIERADIPELTQDFRKAITIIYPTWQEDRQAKIDKLTGFKAPQDTLCILDLTTGEKKLFPKARRRFTGLYTNDYLGFKYEIEGNDSLYIYDLHTDQVIDTIPCVSKCVFSNRQERAILITKPSDKDSTQERGIFSYNFATKELKPIMTGEKKSTFTSMEINEDGSRGIFFANLDTLKNSADSLDLFIFDSLGVRKLVGHRDSFIRDGWELAQDAKVTLFDDHITFGIRPIPAQKDTTLPEFERAELDIWGWQDDYIQTVQNYSLASDLKDSYLAKIDFDGSDYVQICDEFIENVYYKWGNTQKYVVGRYDKPYRRQQQWLPVNVWDLYRVSLETGERELVEREIYADSWNISPDGRFYSFFDRRKTDWFIYDVCENTIKNITEGIDVSFVKDDNDYAGLATGTSNSTWSRDSRYVFIKDKYDFWMIDAFTNKATRVTNGREEKISFGMLGDPKSTKMARLPGTYSALDMNILQHFSMFNTVTKEHGFATVSFKGKKPVVKKLVMGPYIYQHLNISDLDNPVYFYHKGNFEIGEDLWTTTDNFKTETRLTEVNPQMKDYNWGTVELMKWEAADAPRRNVEGLLFKPEDFDPNKKYPVIIYLYERYAHELYQPRDPMPSASSINIPYFVSNGYIVFVPDIWFETGHPGKSCLNTLMPACDSLCKKPWIDADNIAIQGQSWGGYQVAYLITQTNRFKCAFAGAPVCNMTSAYGGIRGISGMARTMQYENGQSRIGKNLWEGFSAYVENSPLFFMDKVETPVLIMANDNDGAVPWQQGIEMFTALRRLGKTAWMLQYNGETHNLSQRKNQMDLSRRQEQFYGHYLKGEPMPDWMSKGIPATKKGIDYGFGFSEK